MIDGGIECGIPVWAVEKAKLVYEMANRSYAMAREAGVNIVMGTDAGTPMNFHGENSDELLSMIDIGFEPMEALTAASIAALTIYDMCKSHDKTMTISDVMLLKKSGGKSGTFNRDLN